MSAVNENNELKGKTESLKTKRGRLKTVPDWLREKLIEKITRDEMSDLKLSPVIKRLPDKDGWKRGIITNKIKVSFTLTSKDK